VAIDSNEFLYLKPDKVAGNQLADGANLRSQVLMTRLEGETTSALTLSLAQKPGDQAMTNRRER